MKIGVVVPLVVAALLTWRVAPADAHPLNVYVQVAEVDVEPRGVTLQLRMTPGVNVARQILAGIDLDHDNVLSPTEQRAYAERVRRDVTLSVDGVPVSLRLVSLSFAPVEQMLQGLGDIVLVFDADAPVTAGTHTIAFENHHQSAIAAYLVNGLQPRDRRVRVTGQDRTYDQSRYQLRFAIGAVAAPSGVGAQGTSDADGGSSVGASSAGPVTEAFFWHGVNHILTGYDHLLFLAALVLGAVTLWELVKVVTAFTVAHSITLTLAALSIVHVPDRLVEPMIAGSIVFVALQNVFWPERARGSSRLVVAFIFGLFHGLGFAGGLLDAMHEMPRGTVLLAILGFSLGVEAGNQMVLLPLYGAMRLVRGSRARAVTGARLLAACQRVGSAGISMAGIYYLTVALAGVTAR